MIIRPKGANGARRTGSDAKAPADQKTVRRHNLGLVLDNVAKGGRRSRARVSAETGLNPSTVSSLIGYLIEQGLLREVGVEQGGLVGRPGRSLEVSPDGGAALGIEIGDEGIGVLALDLSGVPRYRAFFSQPNQSMGPREVVSQLAALTQEALASFKSEPGNVICTIALPGLIGGSGRLLEAPNIGWHEVPIADLWHEFSSSIPLVMENEARLAAYAEMSSGVASKLHSFAYISGGTGLGAGLVIDRKVFKGAHGFAGEFGHVTIDMKGQGSSWGGRGTVQSLAGERALAEFANLSASDRTDRNDPDWVGRQIAKRAEAGDLQAIEAIEKIGHALGVGISVVSNLFDMEAIVLGGYLTHLEKWISSPIDQELDERVITQRWQKPPILFSTMGREAAVRGAALWSLDTILSSVGREYAA